MKTQRLNASPVPELDTVVPSKQDTVVTLDLECVYVDYQRGIL